jgi:micrococcal nuclease
MDFYTYKAKVVGVYDGDTITCEVDLGFEVKMTIKVRLLGIDTPELRGEEREAGLVVRDIVREMILDKEIHLKTKKDKTGKYGRYLGEVFVKDFQHVKLLSENYSHGTVINLNNWLINHDHAKVYGS